MKYVSISTTGFNRLLVLSCLVLLGFQLNFGQVSRDDIRKLKPDQTVRREITTDRRQSYEIYAQKGEFLRVRLEQKGANVLLKLFDPGSQLIEDRNLPIGAYGEESLSVETAMRGNYVLVVELLEKDTPSGEYEVRIEKRQAPTQDDTKRIAAERSLYEAIYVKQESPAVLKQIEATLVTWRDLNDKYTVAVCLMTLSLLNASEFKYEEAIDQYKQAKKIYVEIGNTAGVVRLDLGFRNLARSYSDTGFNLAKRSEAESSRAALMIFGVVQKMYNALGDKSDEARAVIPGAS